MAGYFRARHTIQTTGILLVWGALVAISSTQHLSVPQIITHGRYSEPLPLLAVIVPVVVICISTRNTLGETESVGVRDTPFMRGIHLLLLAGIAIAALAMLSLTMEARLFQPAVRNFLGLLGLGLFGSIFLGARGGWVVLVVAAIGGSMVAVRSNGAIESWAWQVSIATTSGSWSVAGALAGLGLGAFIVFGPNDPIAEIVDR